MQVNYYSLTVLFLAAVCWWFGGALAQSQLLNEERLLELHNGARSSVIPPASFMLKMEWNDKLAKVAQAYAEKCKFDDGNEDRHEQLRMLNFTQIGENMYPFIRPIANLDYAKVIEEWKRGERYYDKEKEICDDDRKAECELYTQLVSAKTHAVGCGVAECPDGNILVCDYGPMVNLDEPPYTICKDDSCLGFTCPEGYYECENKLCCPDTTPPPGAPAPPGAPPPGAPAPPGAPVPPGAPPPGAPAPPVQHDDCSMMPSEQCYCMDAHVSVTCYGEDTGLCNEDTEPTVITRCFCYKVATRFYQKSSRLVHDARPVIRDE